MEITTLSVKGMSCQHCVKTVEATVGALPGVKEVTVDLGRGEARVTHDPAKAPRDALVRAIEEQGYEAR